MNHATFEVGDYLYDTVHNRQIRILEHVNPDEVFVQSMVSPDTYTIEKKHLFTGDEIDCALESIDARHHLQNIRKNRREDD